MGIRTGRVVRGAIVLDGDETLEEGSSVAVWVGDHTSPVRVTEEELELVRRGDAAVARGEVVDAREFLRTLTQERVHRG